VISGGDCSDSVWYYSLDYWVEGGDGDDDVVSYYTGDGDDLYGDSGDDCLEAAYLSGGDGCRRAGYFDCGELGEVAGDEYVNLTCGDDADDSTGVNGFPNTCETLIGSNPGCNGGLP
jgi:hypothetical protein